MSTISDSNHMKILNDNNINIKTIYSDGRSKFERNSNNKKNDSIISSSIIEKDYYVNNKLLKKTYGFNPRIDYTSFNTIPGDTNYECVNCKIMFKTPQNMDRCPFCGAQYRMDYHDKDFGTKGHYDRITLSIKTNIAIALLVLFISFASSYLILKRVMEIISFMDVLKVIGLGLIIALVLYFAYYLFDNLLIKLPIKIKRDKILKNDKALWESLDYKDILFVDFYNNMQSELDKYYYVDNNFNIIDFDIIDYNDFKLNEDASNLYLDFNIIVREVRYEKNKINIKVFERSVTFKKNNKPVIGEDSVNMINCHNCGTPINIKDDRCHSCDAYNNYKQEWYLIKIS